MTNAFVPNSFLFGSNITGATNQLRISPLTTPRRTRSWSIPHCARSLDSYREGDRFHRNVSDQNHSDINSKPTTSSPVRRKLQLPNAMVKMSIASMETCLFLIETGRVRINGQVVTSTKAKIDRFKDRVSVKDTDFGTVDEQLSGTVVGGFVTKKGQEPVQDDRILPRTQRDAKMKEGVDRRYRPNVDRGFFSGRTRRASK